MIKPYYEDASVTLYHGDALDVLRSLPDHSVDAVVTDPPYGLEFMGREWDGADGFRRSLNAADAGRESVFGRASRTSPEYRAGALYQQWCEAWAAECLRVLKPGGHLLAFGGTRTVHRLTCATEDAGFEIRDGIDWIYGSGFPKSLDVSKAIDKAAGAEREVIRPRTYALANDGGYSGGLNTDKPRSESAEITAPATDAAARWSGWGTALKPAREPIVVARKPLVGTVAANMEAYGTGALNIDACRVEGVPPSVPQWRSAGGNNNRAADGRNGEMSEPNPAGRWPSNVVLDEFAAAELDRQSGDRPGMGARVLRRGVTTGRSIGSYDAPGNGAPQERDAGYGDSGGASRFFPVFRYEAKAPTAERPRTADGTAHPTVKPLDLMRWLVRLVTPPQGVVLDPFAGSGTTGEACVVEGFQCVLVERESAYLPLIVGRLSKPLQVTLFGEVPA